MFPIANNSEYFRAKQGKRGKITGKTVRAGCATMRLSSGLDAVLGLIGAVVDRMTSQSGQAGVHATRLRNIHEAAVSVTTLIMASGQSSGYSVSKATPSR